MPEQNKNNMLFRDFSMDGNVDEAARTVDISFSSEAPVKRYDWLKGCYYDEILGHDAGNVDLSRLQNMGVALFNHNRDQVIGAIIEPILDSVAHRCKAKIRFDTDDFSETIYQKVKAGTLKGISVGYHIDNMEIVADGKKSADGRFAGPCRVARLWTPFEASVVSLPADTNVGIGRDMNVDPAELEAFRQYQAAKKQQQRPKEASDALDCYKRDMDILEMEC